MKRRRRTSIPFAAAILCAMLYVFPAFSQDAASYAGFRGMIQAPAVVNDTVVSARYWSIVPVGTGRHDTVMSSEYWSIVVPRVQAVDVVDMGQVYVGDLKDSTVGMYLTNPSGFPIGIDGISVDPPFDVIDSTPLPCLLAKDASMSVTFRFQPGSVGVFSDSVIIRTQTGTVVKQIRGQGLNGVGSVVIFTDTIRARVGDLVLVPLRLRNVHRVTLNTVFHSELRFNATLLAPTGSTPSGVIDNGERRIAVDIPWTQSADEGVLTTLQFLALLGNTDNTPLRVEHSYAGAGQVVMLEVPGHFLLTDVCREGGPRYFIGGGTVHLSQNRPNPFNARTVIDYEILEAGPTRLFVTDIYGRTLATLSDGMLLPGKYSVAFNAERLASGIYITVLQTPTATKCKMMEIAK
jgi:hypothetical protein